MHQHISMKLLILYGQHKPEIAICMKKFWNERFRNEKFAYGQKPNSFFREQLWEQKFGRVLLPGEGEGRDARYAAQKGWLVHAYDFSEVAASKAVVSAFSENLKFEYQISSVEEFETALNFYHLVSVSFLHLPELIRKSFHSQLFDCLLPGGKVIAEYFSKQQIDRDSGGPKNPDMLYSREELASDLTDFNILNLTEEEVLLDNGSFHQDLAWVIRVVAEKPGQ